MSLKFVLYAVVAYLLVRAVLNLLRAMRRQHGVGAGPSRSGGNQRRGGRSAEPPAEEERATRLREDEDVEDAKWEDV